MKTRCPQCDVEFEKERDNHKFCSMKCRNMHDRRTDRPTREELHDMVWRMPTTKIAEFFGVSDVAVRKWCVSYGIDKPPRGYWAKHYSDEEMYEVPERIPPSDISDYCPRRWQRMFSDEDIRRIRTSKASGPKLAREFACNQSTINDIRNYRTYREVR